MISLPSILVRQLAIITSGVAISVTLTSFFGAGIGLMLNILIFIGIIAYIRRNKLRVVRSLFFSDRIGVSRGVSRRRSDMNGSLRVNYICLVCGSEVKGVRCNKCGYSMKKATFR